MINANLDPKPESVTAKWEPAILAGILLLYVALGAGMCSWWPEPWTDEVMYTDPAVRYTAGKGFTSAAWIGQNPTEFWAGNCPLHQILLIPWLELFGATAQSARSLNVLYGALSALVLWLSARQGRWIASAGGRLGLVFLLLSSSSLTFMAHFGRPDAITLLLASGMVWAFTAAPDARRKWLVALLGALAPWAGLQLCAMAAACAFFYLLLARRQAWPLCLWLAGGVGMGLITLGGFYAAHGVAVQFLKNTVALPGHSLSGNLAQMVIHHDGAAARAAAGRFQAYLHFYHVWFVDASYPWVLLSVFVCSLWAWKKRVFQLLSPLGFALTGGMGVPIIVLLAGKYPVYYGWMGFFIISLCAMSAISRFWGVWGGPMRGLATVPLLAACWAGLPRQWLYAGAAPEFSKESFVQTLQLSPQRSNAGARVDLAKIQDFVRANLSPSDHVLVDGAAYYASVNRAVETYYLYTEGSWPREIPSAEREALTAMVILPSDFEFCAAKAGGQWKAGPGCEFATDPSGRPRSLTLYRREK